jgi:hypothetical protein
MSVLTDAAPLLQEAADVGDDLAAVSYDRIPYIERRWLWNGYVPLGSVCIWAAKGETGKGMLFGGVAARTVLGLPFPGEDQETRHEPGQVVWISGPGEDDQFEDLAPRFRAAIAAAVEEFGLDPELAGENGVIRFVHDLSVWRDDSPVTLPADCTRVRAEITKINKRAEQLGEPRVTLVVADSLSAVLSQGYTIDSRQGATKVMVKLGQFARRADVGFPVLHHLTKDGKVAGSAAVLNSVRLAFIIDRAPDNEDVRLITRHKSNISEAQPQRYIITGHGPDVHAVFVEADDARTERVTQAQARAGALAEEAPVPGSLRARMAAAQPRTEGGQFRLIKRVRRAGQTEPDEPVESPPYASRVLARSAADRDAGRVLTWQATRMPGMEMAGYRDPAGNVVTYGVSSRVLA